jgi:glucosamine--fructose-6-phosphate aminotransferase (isomerizing)
MCGIVAYVGRKIAQPVLVEGLKRLEYRGYDSAGVDVVGEDGTIHLRRSVGRISVLEAEIERHEEQGQTLPASARVGMAHTRWATHGAATRENAHPHSDSHGKIAVVHNGIIENYIALKSFLEEKGHSFQSETDT